VHESLSNDGVSNNIIQLSYFRPGRWILHICQFQAGGLEQAQKYSGISDAVVALGIGLLYNEPQLDRFLVGCINF